MNKINIYILILVIFIFFISTCTEPKITNPYDPEYELPAPNNLQIDQPTVNSCRITWKDNAENEVGYKIKRKVDQKKQPYPQNKSTSNEKIKRDNFKLAKEDSTEFAATNNHTRIALPGKNDSTNTKGDWQIIDTLASNVEIYRDTELNPNADYNYRVYAYAGENVSEEKEKSVNMQFPSPTDFVIVQTRLTSCELNWNYNMSGIDGFRIDRKVNNNSWVINYASTSSNGEYEDTEVLPDSSYTYRVYAFIDNYESSKKTCNFEIDFAEPNNLELEQENVHTFVLEWEYPTTWPTGFKIDRRIDSREWTEGIDSVDVNTTIWTDTGVRNNYETVYYRVYAYYSDYISNKVSIDSNIEFDAPTDLDYEKVAIDTISLSWQDNSDGESGFKIDKKVGTAGWVVEYDDVNEDDTTWIDSTAEINENIQYRVYAVSGDNYSDSVETDVIDNIFPAPTDLVIIQEDVHTFTLNWQDNSDGEQGFKIERKIDDGNFSLIYKTDENDTTYVDDINNRTQLDSVFYQIYAFYSSETSDTLHNSHNISFSAPTDLDYDKVAIDTISLSWQDNSNGECGFKIDKKVGTAVWVETYGKVNEDDTTWIDSTAEINENIQYRVYAFSGENYSDSVETDVIDNIFPAPTALEINQEDVHTFTLNWQDNSDGEQGFKIERKIDDGIFSLIYTTEENATTYVDDINNRAQLDSVFYQIYAFYSSETSDTLHNSHTISFPAPTNLHYEKVAIDTISLSWQDNSNGESGFKIDKKVGTAGWVVEYDDVNEDDNTWIDSTAEINENIQYRVYAVSGDNYSDSVVTELIDNTFPAPTALEINQEDVHTFTLNWQDNSDGEQGFKIERKIDDGNYTLIYNTDENDTTYVDDINTRTQLDSVFYQIYAFYSSETSDTLHNSHIISFPAPTDLEYEILSSTSLDLDWKDNSDGEDGFKIERKINNGSWDQLAEVNEDVTQYTDNTVNGEDTFYYRVYAYSGANQSAYSNELSYFYMVFVQGATFDMGDHYDEGGSDELPVHSVTLDDFYIGETEVTHQQVIDVFNWAYSQGYINCSSSSVTNNQGDSQELLDLDDGDCAIDWYGSSLEFGGSSYAPTADCPCIEITWYGSVAYCNYKSLQEGLDTCYDLSDWSCDFDANGYRLPTEAEWEYAARGGVHWTDDYRYSGCHEEADLPDYAWYNANSNNQTHPVGTKLPNQLDIYDMSGNVSEWCNDWFASDYYSSSPSNNPTGPNSGSGRVLRGGSWSIYFGCSCRVADRHYNPGSSTDLYGFRFIRAH